MDGRSADNKDGYKAKYDCPNKTGRSYGFNNLPPKKPQRFLSTREDDRQQQRYGHKTTARSHSTMSVYRDKEYEKSLFVGQTAGINFDLYDTIPVNVEGDASFEPLEEFKQLNLGDVLNLNVELCGYNRPTPIQKHGVPILLKGYDLMACSQTGSGKTAAYLLPIVHNLVNREESDRQQRKLNIHEPSALILAPTRELTQQIQNDALKLLYRTGLRVVSVYGGTSHSSQLSSIYKGCDIMIATPGRLNDFISRGVVNLSLCKILVFDEADRMLDMGFEPQIMDILQQSRMPTKENRQNAMFSATFPIPIQRLAEKFMRQYVKVTIGRVGSISDNIKQEIIQITNQNKDDVLLKTLNDLSADAEQPPRVLIFADKKYVVDTLEILLYKNKHRVVSIHGDRSQMERDEALQLFRLNKANIMVATDVAQRGLDIPNVSHVINYTLPKNIDDYVHRIGRTGRAGNTGCAISFYTYSDSGLAQALVKVLSDNKQTIPDFLQGMTRRYGSTPSYSGYNSSRSGQGNRPRNSASQRMSNFTDFNDNFARRPSDSSYQWSDD